MKNSFCDKCLARPMYSVKYDANYCSGCNVWLEKNCGDASCTYCYGRPEKPADLTQKGN